MKRSPALQPLSREHHQALKLAKQCERAAASGDSTQIELTCRKVSHDFANQLEPHFHDEETQLLPYIPAEQNKLVQRTLNEHAQLRSLCGLLRKQEAVVLVAFANLLVAHIRFEETELFPAVEATLDLNRQA